MSRTPAPWGPVGWTGRRAPSVTVVVATRDRVGPLRRAVGAVLAQDYPGRIEVVVVFDRCDPVDLGLVPPPGRALRAVVNRRAPGLAGARNTGIGLARGEYVAFCDDDDAWFPDKLSAQMELVLAVPGAVAVGSGVRVSSAGGTVERLVPRDRVTLADLLRDRVMALHSSTLVFEREHLLALGGVDEELPGSYAEDYDLLLRTARTAPVPCVPRALVRVEWGGSLFAGRFGTIADALTHLLAKHPEFASVPRGLARIEGQVAFYRAAQGRREEARRWAVRALRHHWREPRAHLAFAVGLRLLDAGTVLRLANARGRGI